MSTPPDDELWSAIGDPSRRQVLDLLVSHGEVSASWLAERVPFSRQAVSKHLVVLERSGLIGRRKQGREVLYQVQAARLDQAARAMADLAAQWDQRLAMIKRLAEAADADNKPPPVDPAVPSPARVWNYWLGGTDNFPVDRELAERVMVAMPSMPLIARFARLFLADAVGRLSELGIRQFLDIGSGVPTADNTHQVAQRLAPESRIVYADRDPTVARHARSLLSSTAEGKTDYLHADLRDPEGILGAAGRTLDLTRSVGVLLIGVLHFIPDADDPYGIAARLMAGLPSGSYLVIGHAASDLAPEAAAEMARRNNQTSPVPITPRTRAQVTRFFDGLDLMPPGVVPISEWDLDGAMDTAVGDLVGYAGLGRKPTRTACALGY